MVEPNLSSPGFLYEEGDELEADELAAMAAKLATPMKLLPGGGWGDGTCVEVGDQTQVLNFQLLLQHQVGRHSP